MASYEQVPQEDVAPPAVQSIRRTASGRSSPSPTAAPLSSGASTAHVDQVNLQPRRSIFSALSHFSPWHVEPTPTPSVSVYGASATESMAQCDIHDLMLCARHWSHMLQALARQFVARLRSECAQGAPLPVFLEESYLEALLLGEQQAKYVRLQCIVIM